MNSTTSYGALTGLHGKNDPNDNDVDENTSIGAIIIAWVNTGIIDGGHGMITIGGERVIPMERFNSLFHHILYY